MIYYLVYIYPALRGMWDRDTTCLKNGKGIQECKDSVEETRTLTTLKQEVETHKFVGSLAGMCDIVSQQANVNRIFQTDVIRYKTVRDTLDRTIRELRRAYLDGRGTHPGGTLYNEVRLSMTDKNTMSDVMRKDLVKLASSSGVGSGVGCTSGTTVGCSSKGDNTETTMGEVPSTPKVSSVIVWCLVVLLMIFLGAAFRTGYVPSFGLMNLFTLCLAYFL